MTEQPAAPGRAAPRLDAGRSGPVVLVGPRAVGKTTIGRLLAKRLGWPFADGDEQLAAAAGMPAGDYLQRAGETAFRDLEERVSLPLLAGQRVVALGGGAVLSASIRARLQEPGCRTILLLAAPSTLAARIRAAAVARPALTALPLDAEVAALLANRLPLYREVARCAFDTDALAPAALVEALEHWLAGQDTSR